MNDFDVAAKTAEKELTDFNEMSAPELAAWFASFYMTAGHKRLGRILVKKAKEAVAA